MNFSEVMETIQILVECQESNPVEVMENILILLESIPLNSNECRMLDDICLDYMKQHGITQNDEIFRLYLKRMSFTYFPGVTKLNIRRPNIVSLPTSSLQSMTPTTNEISPTTDLIDFSEERMSGNDTYSDHESLLLAVNYTPSGFQYKCTMERRRTALQTSYRLYIDGCSSLSTDGSFSRSDSSSNVDPFLSLQLALKGLVLCAKKQNRNLGLSSSYQIWGPCGCKEWKEKNAVGKVTRNNGIYCGTLTEFGQETLTASCPPQYLPYLPTNKRCISAKVLSGGLDKLLHVVAAIQVDPSSHEIHTTPTCARTSPPTVDLSPETTHDPDSPINSDPAEDDPELVLPSIVESICSSKSSSSQLSRPLPSNTFLLQSRRPKKLKLTEQQPLLSSSSSSYYTIHYGESGRVKNPSRKNIVMERMKYDSAHHTVHNNIFHTSDGSKNDLHLLEPEWMSNESPSTSPRSSGKGYSPPVDFPILQVYPFLCVVLIFPCAVWEDE
jgi:hypothetical protein